MLQSWLSVRSWEADVAEEGGEELPSQVIARVANRAFRSQVRSTYADAAVFCYDVKDHLLRLFRRSETTGAAVKQLLKFEEGFVVDVAAQPGADDLELVAALTSQGVLRAWRLDLSREAEAPVLDVPSLPESPSLPLESGAVRWLHSGDRLLAAFGPLLAVWDLPSRAVVHSLRLPVAVFHVSYPWNDPSLGTLLAVCDLEHRVHILTEPLRSLGSFHLPTSGTVGLRAYFVHSMGDGASPHVVLLLVADGGRWLRTVALSRRALASGSLADEDVTPLSEGRLNTTATATDSAWMPMDYGAGNRTLALTPAGRLVVVSLSKAGRLMRPHVYVAHAASAQVCVGGASEGPVEIFCAQLANLRLYSCPPVVDVDEEEEEKIEEDEALEQEHEPVEEVNGDAHVEYEEGEHHMNYSSLFHQSTTTPPTRMDAEDGEEKEDEGSMELPVPWSANSSSADVEALESLFRSVTMDSLEAEAMSAKSVGLPAAEEDQDDKEDLLSRMLSGGGMEEAPSTTTTTTTWTFPPGISPDLPKIHSSSGSAEDGSQKESLEDAAGSEILQALLGSSMTLLPESSPSPPETALETALETAPAMGDLEDRNTNPADILPNSGLKEKEIVSTPLTTSSTLTASTPSHMTNAGSGILPVRGKSSKKKGPVAEEWPALPSMTEDGSSNPTRRRRQPPPPQQKQVPQQVHQEPLPMQRTVEKETPLFGLQAPPTNDSGNPKREKRKEEGSTTKRTVQPNEGFAEPLLAEQLRAEVRAAVREEMQQSFGPHGVHAMASQAFREQFLGALAPAFDASLKLMFMQMHEMFQRGVGEFRAALAEQPSASSQLPPPSRHHAATDESSAGMQEAIRALASTAAGLTATVDAMQARMVSAFSDAVAELQQQHSSSAAPGPSRPAVSSAPSRQSLHRLVQQGRLDEAFTQALDADFALVLFLVRRLNPMFVVGNGLSQVAMLCLFQQLSAQLPEHMDISLNWLTQLVTELDAQDPSIAPHLVDVMQATLAALDALAADSSAAFRFPAAPRYIKTLRILVDQKAKEARAV